MKRIIAFLLALVLTGACVPVMPAIAEESQPFAYQIIGDGTLVITGYTGSGGDVVIPETIDGYTVSGIGNCAFSDSNITSIFIPKTVISISTQPFVYQEKLEKITVDAQNPNFFSDAYGVVYTRNDNGQSQYKELVVAPSLSGTYTVPDGVGYIRSHAFEYYNNLEKLILGKDVYSIGTHAFEGCRELKELVFTGSMDDSIHSNWIQSSAFSGCSKLETLVLPDGLKTIDSGAFYGCKSLKTINIPASVTSIGSGAFTDTDSLTAIIVDPANTAYKNDDKGVLYTADGLTLHSAPGGLSGSYSIPEGVTTVGDNAFYNCDKLTGISFPSTVTTLGNYAFQYCTGLTELTIPGTIKELPLHAFYHCEGLTALRISKGVAVIGENAFDGCEKLTHVAFPSTLTKMGKWAFFNCNNLKTISFRSQVPEFDPEALAGGCDKTAYYYSNWSADALQNYGGNITWVPVKAAGDCGKYLDWTLEEDGTLTIHGSGDMQSCAWSKYNSDVTSIVFDGKITSVCDKAFYGGTELTEVTFPETMTQIGAQAFYGCAGIEKLSFAGDAPAIADDAFKGVMTEAWYLPLFSGWNENTLVNYGGALTWKARELTGTYGETSIWTLDAEGTLTVSGTGGFSQSEEGYGFEAYKAQIKRIVIEEGITDISGFDGCVNLTEVQFPDSLTCIEWNAFANCTALTELSLPEGLERISDMAFSGCAGLTTVVLPDSVRYVSIEAFAGCAALTDVYLSKNLESLWNPFPNCPNLKGVWAAEDSRWFNDEQGILYGPDGDNWEIVYIPSTVSGCLTVADGVTYILWEAGHNATGITELSLPEGMGEATFESINSLNAQLTQKGQSLTTVTFRGNAPEFYESCLYDLTLTIRYPVYDSTWTSVVGKNYDGSITWESYDDSISYGTSGTLSWVLKNDGHMIISGTGAMKQYAIPVIAYAGLIKKLTVKEGVTGICAEAFANCVNLTQVSLPQSLTDIGSGALRNCSAITEMTIPASVANIGSEAFSGCTGLAQLQFDMATAPTIGENALTGVAAVCLYPAENESWLSVITEKFGGEPQWTPFYLLKDAKCGDNVTATMTHEGKLTVSGTGDMYDFEMVVNPWRNYKSFIKEVIVEEGVTHIGMGSFFECPELQQVTLPKSLKTISYDAFSWSGKLQSITIPENVTEIYSWAFAGSGLKEIYFMGNAPQMQDALMELTATAYYPANNETWTADVQTAAGGNITWVAALPTEGSCGENVTWKLESGVLTISGTGAMTDYLYFDKLPWYTQRQSIQKIVVEEGVTALSTSAFYGCSNVTEVTLPVGLTEISAGIFSECTGLRKINIPNTVTAIRTEAFTMCESLTALELPECLNAIGDFAFGGCTNLLELSFPDKVIRVGISAVSDTAWYKAQPDGVVYVGKTACGAKGAAADVRILKSDTESVGSSSFKTKTLILSSGLTSISLYGMYDTEVLIFTGSAPEFTSFYTGATLTAYYPANDPTWTEAARPGYDGQVTWVPYTEAVQAGNTVYPSFAQAAAACEEGGYVKLLSDAQANVMLSRDLYVDLNGFDLGGTLELNGFKVYGMDNTTDNYTCQNMGYFTCTDTDGNTVAPEVHVKTTVTGAIRRYLAIKTADGYTFHRLYMGVTNQSVRPKTTGVGFKAVVYGDDMVAAQLKSYGFTMQLGHFTPKHIKRDGKDFVSGKEVSLLIGRYDVENYGETQLQASVMLELVDGTVIESETSTMTMRGMMEEIDRSYTSFSDLQLQLLREMLQQYEAVKNWNISNLLPEENL